MTANEINKMMILISNICYCLTVIFAFTIIIGLVVNVCLPLNEETVNIFFVLRKIIMNSVLFGLLSGVAGHSFAKYTFDEENIGDEA